MLLIISHHYVVNSGLTSLDGPIFSNPLAIKSIFLLIFGAWGKIGINCFLLITGYFMCKSKITAHKFFKLLFEVLFYKIIIYFIFLISGYESFSWVGLAKAFLPITAIEQNFVGCFLVFYLFIPFINVLVHNLNKKQHFYLLLLIFFVFVILGTIPKIYIIFNYVTWFVCIYLIGSFLGLYPNKYTESTKLWGLFSVLMLVLTISSVFVLQWAYVKYEIGSWSYLVSDSNRILAVFTAISWFLFFKNLKIKQSRIINLLGGATFGVLLIHANSDTMRTWLWKDLLHNVEVYDNGNLIFLHAFCAVLGIFIVCLIIEIIRQFLIEKPFMNLFDKIWGRISIWYLSKEQKCFKDDTIPKE